MLPAALLAACSEQRPQQQAAQTETIPPVYLEALQNAEAARHSLEQHEVEQQRVDALIGRENRQPPDR
ncbi:MAG: hypothetical protein KDI82_06260 [Gammaproteobacteria bacterium]|nr:hypothetical protein [Gammaproteobacteria bacterium]